MPHSGEAEAVLARWRAVERELSLAEPGSDEAEELEAEAARLQEEYRRLIDQAHERQRPPTK
jgi:hypothetical protein